MTQRVSRVAARVLWFRAVLWQAWAATESAELAAPQALVKFAELLLMHATLVLFRIATEQRALRRDSA